jgi:hypothetical protein
VETSIGLFHNLELIKADKKRKNFICSGFEAGELQKHVDALNGMKSKCSVEGITIG